MKTRGKQNNTGQPAGCASSEYKRQLWASLHPKSQPIPPIGHAIPKLTLPARETSTMERINRFVEARVRALSAAGLAIALATVCSGCTMITYTSPDGAHFTRRSFGAATAISSLQLESGTNGIRRIELQGYRNDSADALGVVTEAAVRAALSKP